MCLYECLYRWDNEGMESTQAFLDRVSEWLSLRWPDSVATAVHPSGSDWDGNTESGFHSSFDVWIEYAKPDGGIGSLDVQGSDLESLWRFVVGGFGPIVDVPEVDRA